MKCTLIQGQFQLALGRYRQCLLRPGFLCTAPAIANSAIIFQRMNNVDAELDARTLLLKVCVCVCVCVDTIRRSLTDTL